MTNTTMTRPNTRQARTEAHSAAETPAGAGRMAANSDAAWLAVAELMPAVTPVIRAMLGPSGMGADVEDIGQETVISAVRGIDRWDPVRGPLVSWVTAIGKRRAIDHLRRAKRQATTAVVFGSHSGEDESIAVIDVPEASFEEQLLDRAEAWGLVKSVLEQVKTVLRNDETMRRAVIVLAECDGDIAAASKWLGVSPAVAREARRQVVRMAIVVHQAQKLRRQQVKKVSIDAARDCLPDETGAWPRTVLDVIANHPTGLRGFGPAELRTATGWSLATCKQRFEDVHWLLSVINEIALRGEFTDEHNPAIQRRK